MMEFSLGYWYLAPANPKNEPLRRLNPPPPTIRFRYKMHACPDRPTPMIIETRIIHRQHVFHQWHVNGNPSGLATDVRC